MHALFKRDLVEWHSIQAFQDVTMRLIAMGVVSVCEEHEPEQDVTSAASKLDQPSTLPPSSPSSRLLMLLQRSLSPSQRSLSPRSPDLLQKQVAHQSKEMYLRLELLRHVPTLPAPRGKFEYHMYCSLHNPGAVELMYEVAREQPGFEVMVTQNAEDLTSCERMLIYLTDQTWTRGATSDAFAVEVELAMKRGTPLLLCHEMPGVDGRSERHGCPFDFFLAEGATPEFLKDVGIYSQIAKPLKGGAWRRASLLMVMEAIASHDSACRTRMRLSMLVSSVATSSSPSSSPRAKEPKAHHRLSDATEQFEQARVSRVLSMVSRL